MGLDLVELLIAVETAFDLDISDDQAGAIITPRDLIAHLASRLPRADPPSRLCLGQRAFYRLRAACQRELGLDRSQLRPSTAVVAILSPHARKQQWSSIQRHLGATVWPGLRQNTLMIKLRGDDDLTLGETATRLAQWHPALLKDAGSGWTVAEIERTVITILEELCGIDMRQYSLDAGFSDGLGLE
jgi:hypothetical protein